MIGYKVITYTCGCKFIYITDPEKRILINHSTCPIHKAPKVYVVIWCKDCGEKLVAVPRSGMRQKRCKECSRLDQLQKVKANWYKYRAVHNAKRRKKPLKTKEDMSRAMAAVMAKKMALRRLYRSMTLDLPPHLDTPVMDRMIDENYYRL